MNVLKKIKFILLGLSALTFSLTLASCNKQEGVDSNGFYRSATNEKDGYNFDKAHLSSIRIDTSKAKTVFFLGEEFTTEGISITANFLNNENKLGSIVTTDFTVDTKEVDMYNIGTYSVTIIYRYKDTVEKQKYDIKVVSSVFEATPDLEFNSGLEATFADNTRIKNYLLGDTLVEKYKNDYDHNYNLDSLLSGLKVKLHKNKTNSDGTSSTEVKTEDIPASQVKVDTGNIDINKVGTYVLKVTYESPEVEVNGTKYSNNVVAFLVINVSDPIESISIIGNNVSFDQSIDGIDAEKAGWKVHVVPTIAAAYNEDFTYAKYAIENVDIFKVGATQDIKVYLIENPKVSCSKTIRINQSTTENIVQYNNLYPKETTTEAGKVITLAETDFIFGPAGATYTANRASSDYYESVTFDERITIKNSNQPIKVVMDKPGKIVVFFASTGDEERELVLYADNQGNLGEELQTEVTPETKQKITRKTFDIPAAGTYYFVNPTGGIYIHGLIIVTQK